jgi:hypothetical protein
LLGAKPSASRIERFSKHSLIRITNPGYSFHRLDSCKIFTCRCTSFRGSDRQSVRNAWCC